MANRKETALDLAKFIDKGVRVKLAGGREGGVYCWGILLRFLMVNNVAPTHDHHHLCTVTGVLKGYDQLLNLVLDETVEYLRGR